MEAFHLSYYPCKAGMRNWMNVPFKRNHFKKNISRLPGILQGSITKMRGESGGLWCRFKSLGAFITKRSTFYILFPIEKYPWILNIIQLYIHHYNIHEIPRYETLASPRSWLPSWVIISKSSIPKLSLSTNLKNCRLRLSQFYQFFTSKIFQKFGKRTHQQNVKKKTWKRQHIINRKISDTLLFITISFETHYKTLHLRAPKARGNTVSTSQEGPRHSLLRPGVSWKMSSREDYKMRPNTSQ